MGVLEHFGAFDPDANQVTVDEKAAVVDFVRCRREMAQPPMLAGNQGIKRSPGPIVTRLASVSDDRGRGVVIMCKHCRAVLGADRQPVLAIGPHRKAFVVGAQLQVTGGQRLGIAGAQKGHEHLAGHVGAGRVPVNIEPVRVLAARPMAQHVQPQPVLVAANAHVVGHDIEDDAHVPLLQRPCERAELIQGAQFRVEHCMIHNVIAVGAARPGFEDGRQVGVADAQIGQIGHQVQGVGKGEVGIELQAIGGAQRDHGRASLRNTMAVSPGRIQNLSVSSGRRPAPS